MKYKIGVNVVDRKEGETAGKVKAYATVCFDDKLTVKDIAVYEGSKGLFASMPGYKNGKVDAHNNPKYSSYFLPITKEFYQELNENIVALYEEAAENNRGYVNGSYNEDDPAMEMKVSIMPTENAGKKKASANLTLDDSFAVKMSVVDGSKGLFVSMPRHPYVNTRTKETVYKDLCSPMGTEGYAAISKIVLDGYTEFTKQKGAVEASAPEKAEQKETEKKKQPPKPSRVK